ncbi:Uncharacterised protein [Mycobacterium tuberculosis]|uniref:Uncharacterized protein n=1 Tax=Mycobacterium tuberculosis TaxID=1773 RepID=A0A916LI92_MYCTX|nr:Uncharacterised protein [Mycobacterium tuberculosis]
MYSWRGRLNTSSVEACSTTRPARMTRTSSAICRITARSWLMNKYVKPRSACRSASRSRICACTNTSSADTASSHTNTSGRSASARAIATRCR